MSEKQRSSRLRQRVIRFKGLSIPRATRQVPAALQLVIGLLTLIIAGTLLLMLPGMAVRPLTPLEALFTATSAAAVTGLSLFPISTELTFSGQLVLLFLIQIGGIGLIVTVALVFRLLGRQVSLTERLAVTSSLGLDRPSQIQNIILRAVVLMLLIEGIGAIILSLYWRISGIVPAGNAIYYGIFHSIAAYCNAGFDLFYGLPEFPNGIPTDLFSVIVLGILIILGGLGIPVYLDFIYNRKKRSFSLHTRLTIIISVILILVGWVGLLISEYRGGGVLAEMNFGERATLAWFQSVSTRTAGYAGLPGFDNLQYPSILLMAALMVIGTAPASTGGGITTGTFAVLCLAVISYARGLDKIRLGKRTLPNQLVLRALVVLGISISLIFLVTWLIVLTNPLPLTEIAFEVVSAYSTTGLSLGITPSLNAFGRLMIILTMFCGRLGAITIMIALLGNEPHTKLVDYPEESILIG